MEKHIEKELRIRVKNVGGWALKFVSPSVRGVPDRIVLMPGCKIYFVELKAEKKKPSPLQILVHDTLRKFGFKVYVIDSIIKVKEFIDEISTA